MLGLGRGKSSNLVSAYVDAGLIKDRQFSVCFSETGGSFMLGKEEGAEEEEEDESDATKWVPAPYSGSHWWKVEVTGMRVGETAVAGKMKAWQEGKGTLVDTVNTDTYVPAALAPALKAAFEAATGVEYIEAFGPGQGYAMTEAQVAALPSLFFDLNGGDAAVGGHTLEVKPAAYLAKTAYKDGGYNYRLLVHATDPAGGVLGANALRDHMVTFDDARSRVGFKQADCAANERERAAAAGRAKPALYKMDGVEYFTRIGARFAVKDRKKFDPLSVTKIPKWTQRECDGDDKEAEMDKEVMDKEMKGGMKMDMARRRRTGRTRSRASQRARQARWATVGSRRWSRRGRARRCTRSSRSASRRAAARTASSRPAWRTSCSRGPSPTAASSTASTSPA